MSRRAATEAKELIEFLIETLGEQIRADTGIGIKPISRDGTKRLVRKAIRYALENNRDSVTLVHKGNIMKFTEGAFRDWGYEVAAEEFGDVTVTEKELWDSYERQCPAGKVLVKDRIADSMFQQILLRPEEYGVLAMPNLNGDYLSDAAAAQVGGLGMAPGANIGDDVALFEATHGTAPKYAGQDKVNPGSADPLRRDDARPPRVAPREPAHPHRHRAGRAPQAGHLRSGAPDGGRDPDELLGVRRGGVPPHGTRRLSRPGLPAAGC